MTKEAVKECEVVKYVGVRHKPEHQNLFWFYVPEQLSNMISVGKTVVCDTRKGKTTGVVAQVIDGFSPTEASKLTGNCFTVKPIVGVEMEFEVCEIHIPWDMQESTPSPEEIAACVSDLYSGRMRTAVSCTPDGNLREGYAAYLVAKMFSHDTLRGFCFVN